MSSQPSSIKPPIWILALGAGLGPFAVTLVAPAIPALRDDLSAGPNIAQLVLTTLLISIALGQLIAGPLSDRFGRRPLFIFGSLAYAVGGIGASLSHSVTTINAILASKNEITGPENVSNGLFMITNLCH